MQAFVVDVPRDQGVGNPECAGEGLPCVRVVADAWCESHGHGPLRRMREGKDQTASLIPMWSAAPGEAATAAYIVSCAR